MYQLEQLTKRFDNGIVALDRVNLRLQPGEHVACIGPSGAGKTTLFRLLNLTLAPTAGRLCFDGTDVQQLQGRNLRAVRRRIGTVYQQHNLVPRLRVVHNVLAGRLGSWPVWKAVLSFLRPVELERAVEALRQVGIPDKLYDRTDTLSGGQQQRVAIARVLVQNPEVILADEPVSSVDPTLAQNIVQLLIEISRAGNKTLLMNLHSVDLALNYFPRIVGMRAGKLVFDLPSQEVTQRVFDTLYDGQEIFPPGEHERLQLVRSEPPRSCAG